MDTEIDELRREVEELKEISADTNRTMHKMRRGQRWATIFQIIWWLSIVGVTGAAYYYYVQPYVEQVIGAYDNAKGLQVQVGDWFAKLSGHSTTTSQ